MGSQLFTSSQSWTVPAHIGPITVLIAAAGAGGGAGVVGIESGGGGGGGGNSAFSDSTSNAGDSITITVGVGGSSGVNGGDSWYGSSANIAHGGSTTLNATGGAGGAGNQATGGAGGAGVNSRGSGGGGGGGGAAGSGGNGGDGSAGSGISGGAGGAGGAGTNPGGGPGTGGDGGGTAANGNNATNYGAGGGGGGLGSTVGGSGSDGIISVSWIDGSERIPSISVPALDLAEDIRNQGKAHLFQGPGLGVPAPSPVSLGVKISRPPEDNWLNDKSAGGFSVVLRAPPIFGKIPTRPAISPSESVDIAPVIGSPSIVYGGRPFGPYTVPNLRPIILSPTIEDILLSRPGSADILGGKPSKSVTPPICTVTIVVPAEDQLSPAVFSAQVYGGKPSAGVTPPVHKPIIVNVAEDVITNRRVQTATIYQGPIIKLPPGSPPVTVSKQEDSYLSSTEPNAKILGGLPLGPVTPPTLRSVIVAKNQEPLELDISTQGSLVTWITPRGAIYAPPTNVVNPIDLSLQETPPAAGILGAPPKATIPPQKVIVSPLSIPDSLDIGGQSIVTFAIPRTILPPNLRVYAQSPPETLEVAQPILRSAIQGAQIPTFGSSYLTKLIVSPQVTDRIIRDAQGRSMIFVSYVAMFPVKNPPTLLDPDVFQPIVTIKGTVGE